MAQDPKLREHAQRDEYMLYDVVTNTRFVLPDGSDCWPEGRARQVAVQLAQNPAAGEHDYRLVHTLTYNPPEDHKSWAAMTDYGARAIPPRLMPR